MSTGRHRVACRNARLVRVKFLRGFTLTRDLLAYSPEIHRRYRPAIKKTGREVQSPCALFTQERRQPGRCYPGRELGFVARSPRLVSAFERANDNRPGNLIECRRQERHNPVFAARISRARTVPAPKIRPDLVQTGVTRKASRRLASSQLAANPASVLRNEATPASSDRAPLSRRSMLFSGLSLAFASERNVDVLLKTRSARAVTPLLRCSIITLE